MKEPLIVINRMNIASPKAGKALRIKHDLLRGSHQLLLLVRRGIREHLDNTVAPPRQPPAPALAGNALLRAENRPGPRHRNLKALRMVWIACSHTSRQKPWVHPEKGVPINSR